MISSEVELSLADANRITHVFIDKLKEAYGEQVIPFDSPHTFYFDVTVNEQGEITSALPTPDQIGKTKGFWSETHKSFWRSNS